MSGRVLCCIRVPLEIGKYQFCNLENPIEQLSVAFKVEILDAAGVVMYETFVYVDTWLSIDASVLVFVE